MWRSALAAIFLLVPMQSSASDTDVDDVSWPKVGDYCGRVQRADIDIDLPPSQSWQRLKSDEVERRMGRFFALANATAEQPRNSLLKWGIDLASSFKTVDGDRFFSTESGSFLWLRWDDELLLACTYVGTLSKRTDQLLAGIGGCFGWTPGRRSDLIEDWRCVDPRILSHDLRWRATYTLRRFARDGRSKTAADTIVFSMRLRSEPKG